MKYFMKVLGILLAGLAGIIIILFLVINHFFFSMSKLPAGEFLTESQSPNGEYTVKAYVSMSGATVADAVRAEVVFQNNNKKKNIYWGYRQSTAEINWIDDHIVSINGVELDVRKDVYDFRKE
ncbi:DUF5412 domain-containing protein [Sporosarcina sp. Marseille-Q4063]|uniref:DUF5412 domain-containing protein n=1 Tax=Sporosarcina sp. Marseille-Q4063 TaxID=2810514 RepID=UPI001BB0431F|nr:DUF5412 domain-containing protein [Sporosarcina sp. Marseille-Q4063]QUW20313.1 DUF5412 domain-containing protein [Sporosarcina sp. Marseille-Q4063]